jgi:hypothetical protein
LLSSKASYDARSTGATVTSSNERPSFFRNSAITADTVNRTADSSFINRLSAASTPLSLSRAANCRMLRYSLAARSGCWISKIS